MNQIATITPVVMTMTSREIADFAGKDLAHVHRDIRAMLDELKKDDPFLDHPQEDKDARGYTTCFYLNRELTDTLLTGYSASARLKVIRRWHELEAKQPKPATFTNPATKELAHQLEVMSLFGVPLHLAQSEATKEVLLLCGVDYSKALKLAPAQQGMLTHEEMLEPTELGRIIGLSAAHMNQRLESAGMQTKTVDGWALTGLGAPYATRHHWQSKNGIKSGYNMKWSRAVLKMLDL